MFVPSHSQEQTRWDDKNVDVYWGGVGSDAWLPATVVGSRIFRPRDTRVRPERRVGGAEGGDITGHVRAGTITFP